MPMYRNGARTVRHIGLREGKRIRVFGAPGKIERLPPLRTRVTLDRWQLPEGSIVVQTFLLDGPDGKPQKVETQIEMNDAGEWRYLNYRWNAAQTDAVLVPESGAMADIPIKGGVPRWRFPSRAECTSCHTDLFKFTLGIHAANLNREVDYSSIGGTKMHQMKMWTQLGFGGWGSTGKDIVMPAPSDESASLENRARAYLHTNCAACHRSGGLGGRAEFSLLGWLKNEDTGIMNAKPLVGLPGGDPEKVGVVVPGDAAHSDLYRRLATDGAGRMPLMGTSKVDKEGAELIRKWIESMPDTK